MSFRRVCVAVLAVQAWSAVWARPSEGTAAAAGGEQINRRVLDRETILNACPGHPNSFPTPQEIAGDWCNLEPQNSNNIPPSCNRVTIRPEGDNLRAILRNVGNGTFVVVRNSSMSQIQNESWLFDSEGRTTNFFVGLSSDRNSLFVCGTTVMGDVVPDRVISLSFSPCLASGEAASGQHSGAVQCDLPQNA